MTPISVWLLGGALLACAWMNARWRAWLPRWSSALMAVVGAAIMLVPLADWATS